MDRFAICQAYQQLEADYNVDGWLRERPSNQRRMESIGVQLHRMGYSSPYEWVDIDNEDDDDCFSTDVREVYLTKVIEWNLPIDADRLAVIKRFFTYGWLVKFPQFADLSARREN